MGERLASGVTPHLQIATICKWHTFSTLHLQIVSSFQMGRPISQLDSAFASSGASVITFSNGASVCQWITLVLLLISARRRPQCQSVASAYS